MLRRPDKADSSCKPALVLSTMWRRMLGLKARLPLALLVTLVAITIIGPLPHFHADKSPDFHDCIACQGTSRLFAPEDTFEIAVQPTVVLRSLTVAAIAPPAPETSPSSSRSPPRR